MVFQRKSSISSSRLVAEREKEIINFVPESYFKTLGQFSKSDNSILTAKYSKNIDEDEKFNEFLEDSLTQNLLFKLLKRNQFLENHLLLLQLLHYSRKPLES